jgi:hypothetical protein
MLSCKEEVKQQPYIVIDLEKAMDKKAPNKLTLNDLAENIRIIPVETNDSVLFPYIAIGGLTAQHVITATGSFAPKQAVYFINKQDGKVSCVLDKEGPGPGEYSKLYSINISEQDSIIYVYDMNKRALHSYNFNGDFIKSIKHDSIGAVQILNDGNFAVSSPPDKHIKYALNIYDKSWNLIRQGLPRGQIPKRAMIHSDGISKYNDECYYHIALGDTLYHITSEYEKPYMVISKGQYKAPDEIFATLSAQDRDGYKYIMHDYISLISKYCFLYYDYNHKAYYEIWDTETLNLLYRSRYGRTVEGKREGVQGIPVSIGDVTIVVWPNYVSGNIMYCVVEPDDALKLIPALPEDTNPILLEVKMR